MTQGHGSIPPDTQILWRCASSTRFNRSASATRASETYWTVTGWTDATNAWLLLTWRSPTSRPTRAAWFPFDAREELAAERDKQLRRHRLQRAVARATSGQLPSPWTCAAGHSQPMPQTSARPVAPQPNRLARPWLRRLLLRLVGAQPGPASWTAARPQLP